MPAVCGDILRQGTRLLGSLRCSRNDSRDRRARHDRDRIHNDRTLGNESPRCDDTLSRRHNHPRRHNAGLGRNGNHDAAGTRNDRSGGTEKDFTQVDLSYFDDALFIGDSRTVGLRDYSVGNLKNATFFCHEGMSAPRAVRDEFDCTSGVDASGKKTTYGKYTLAELLTEKKFGKIYVMVGINELGYPSSSIAKGLQVLADTIRQYQPDTVIFFCANLHVTKEYSDSGAGKYVTNPKINEVNSAIAKLADGKNSFYIDVNEYFDDASHALTAGISGDGVHVYGKYYREWSVWLCTKGIVR